MNEPLAIPLSAYPTPAARVIAAFGSARQVALAVGRNRSSVTRWVQAAPNGLDGRVPSALQKKILEVSDERGLGLKPEHLI